MRPGTIRQGRTRCSKTVAIEPAGVAQPTGRAGAPCACPCPILRRLFGCRRCVSRLRSPTSRVGCTRPSAQSGVIRRFPGAWGRVCVSDRRCPRRMRQLDGCGGQGDPPRTLRRRDRELRAGLLVSFNLPMSPARKRLKTICPKVGGIISHLRRAEDGMLDQYRDGARPPAPHACRGEGDRRCDARMRAPAPRLTPKAPPCPAQTECWTTGAGAGASPHPAGAALGDVRTRLVAAPIPPARSRTSPVSQPHVGGQQTGGAAGQVRPRRVCVPISPVRRARAGTPA